MFTQGVKKKEELPKQRQRKMSSDRTGISHVEHKYNVEVGLKEANKINYRVPMQSGRVWNLFKVISRKTENSENVRS